MNLQIIQEIFNSLYLLLNEFIIILFDIFAFLKNNKDNILGFFNNREWALIVWFLIILICITIIPKFKCFRKSFKDVVGLLFKFIFFYFLMTIYVLFSIFLLRFLNLWDVADAKDTIVWSILVAFVAFYKINNINKVKTFFKDWLLDNLKLIAVYEFLVNYYRCNLIAEFFYCTFFFYYWWTICFI